MAGSLWFDGKTSSLRRIKFEPTAIDQGFPEDLLHVETEYEAITLRGNEKYVLPSQSTIIQCFRANCRYYVNGPEQCYDDPVTINQCKRNVVEFHNYRLFGAETRLILDGTDAPGVSPTATPVPTPLPTASATPKPIMRQ
jgi:hypothetical protein